jgi:hypothetical protein
LRAGWRITPTLMTSTAVGSWPQIGVPAGLFLSTVVFLIVQQTTSDAAFLSWGWRIPFLLSVVLIAIGLFVRPDRTGHHPLYGALSDRVGRRPLYLGRGAVLAGVRVPAPAKGVHRPGALHDASGRHPVTGCLGEGRVDLDRGQLRRHPGQDLGREPWAGTDLEHPPAQLGALQHRRHQGRLYQVGPAGARAVAPMEPVHAAPPPPHGVIPDRACGSGGGVGHSGPRARSGAARRARPRARCPPVAGTPRPRRRRREARG